MAQRALQLSKWIGPIALCAVVGPILAALIAVGATAEGKLHLGPGDWAAIRFTLVQSFLSAAFSVALAIPAARALARRRFRGRSALITLMGAPFILPVIVAVFGLLTVFGRAGWISSILGAVGMEPVSIYGLHGVVVAHVFFNLPLAVRLILQGWNDIPAERFRTAALLDFGPNAVFRIIEWPMLRKAVPGAFALIFAICLTSFAVALTLGGGPRATTIELAIYQAFRFDFDLGRAALLSIYQLGIAGCAAAIALLLIPLSFAEGGLNRPVQRWDTTPAWVDYVWLGLASAFLIVPLSAIVLSGLAGLPDVPVSVWHSATASLYVAFISVVVLMILVLPLAAWMGSRKRSGIEAASLLGLAASPLMIGTGWFILINPVIDPQTVALPVTAFVNALMALPFAIRMLAPAVRSAIADHGRLAQSLNLPHVVIWRYVLWPRLRAPLGFSLGLAAALSVGDLGVIALFADPDRATLPLQMYRLMGAYRVDAAAGAALILLALAFTLFLLFDRWGRANADS
ncbi:MAG: thiamine/thiamine pyrophosphate ABC transporter permease ThiP [Paracoccaceae bacterium]